MINIRALLMLMTLVMGSSMSIDSSASDILNGKKVYQGRCALCHGDRGKAVMPGTPDLSRQQGMQKSNSALLERLQRGQGSCPPFRGMIRDEHLNDVISYIRTLRRQ